MSVCSVSSSNITANNNNNNTVGVGTVTVTVCSEQQPLLKVVDIIKQRMDTIHRQRNKYRDSSKSSKDEEQRANAIKYDELTQVLEFAWDLCKQIMGIAVLNDNETKKQARKENVVRKTQNIDMVQNVLLVIDCLEQLADPAARTDFLNGTSGASRLQQNDLDVLDNIYAEVTPKHLNENGETFYDQSLNAAKHLVSIVDGSEEEVVGSTYVHIKGVVDSVHNCGYFETTREPEPEPEPAPVEVAPPIVEEQPQEIIFVPPQAPVPAVPLIPPPVPQSVPAPSFPIIPTTVTLQQVEHAYFTQQYGHPKPTNTSIPEVFGPQNFVFLQESEIEPSEHPRQPSPRPISPSGIPSQTYTNQNFGLPPLAPLTEIPPVAHYPNLGEVQQHIPGYPPTTAPPMALPLHATLPPHIPIPAVHPVVPPQAHNVPSPSYQQHNNIHYKPEPVEAPKGNDTDYSEWGVDTNTNNIESQDQEPLEINQWNPADGNTADSSQPSNDKYRKRGGNRPNNGNSGGYRSRGSYQNGRGSYYKNDNNYHAKINGENESSDVAHGNRDGHRFDNSKSSNSNFNNFRGDSGFKNRNNSRINQPSSQHSGDRVNGNRSARERGGENRGPPRPTQNGNAKPYYSSKKQGNGHFESRSEGKQQQQQQYGQ